MENTAPVCTLSVIIDLTTLQASGGSNPRERALHGLARNLAADNRVKYLATHSEPLPAWLKGHERQVVYALSRADRGLTILGTAEASRRYPSNSRFAEIVWGGQSFQLEADGRRFDFVATTVVDAQVSALDALVLQKLANAGLSFHIVTPDLAADKDLMRGLIPLARSENVKLVVANGRAAVSGPEVIELELGSSALLSLVSRAASVLLKAGGEPELLSADEVIAAGGKATFISKGQIIKSLSGLEAARPTVVAGGATVEAFLSGLQSSPRVAAEGKPRLALVTPLATDEGDIETLTVPLAQALAEYCQVDLWTDGSALEDSEISVRSLEEGLDGEAYDEVVYMLGNDPAYGGVLDALAVTRGTVIQRDAHLLDLLDQRFGFEKLKSTALAETGNRKPYADFAELSDNIKSLGSPLLSPVCSLANGIIVHSRSSADMLQAKYDIEVNHIPAGMPYTFSADDLSEATRRQAKTDLDLDPSKPCIIAFGKVDMRNGAKRCLIALHELKVWGQDFEFVFAGSVKPKFQRRLEKYIKAYELEDNVRFTGKLRIAEYIKYLRAGDIALQMNDPTFGQVSSGLLDAVSAGMPSLASSGLVQALEAPSWVRTVNDKASPFIYAEQLLEMITSGAYLHRPVADWQAYVQERSLSGYAKRLAAVIFGEGRA